jgi:hypothetical protein
MTLINFILFLVGAISEYLLLIENAYPEGIDYTSSSRLKSWFIYIMYNNMSKFMALALGGLALIIIAGLSVMGWGEIRVYINSPLVSILFLVIAIAILIAALLPAYFVPPINEQTILITQALVLLGAFWQRQSISWLPAAVITVVPGLVGLVLLVWKKTFSLPLKVVLYFWYLCSLMILPFQSGQMGLFNSHDFTWLEALSFGYVFVFIFIHGFLAMRFLLLIGALVLPRNRALLNDIMPLRFKDEQVSVVRFSLVAGLALSVLWINQQIGWVETNIATAFVTLASIQILNWRPVFFKGTERN